MTELDKKINEQFRGLVVRKDLVKTVKGNAIVPTYVLEYLLGQYCATSDEDSIQSGIGTVKEILRKHYVHRNEAGRIRSDIKERGRYKVIDKISVSLNEKTNAYEASFSNLGIKKVLVDSITVKKHPKLLVNGVWCIADIEYMFTEDKNSVPWVLSGLKPIQLSSFDYESYIEARKQFSMKEWIDMIIQSIGFDPEKMSNRYKMLQLVRLIPYCERNYNLMELGPKGTGKSHLYSEFSPHGILLSGGEVTVAKLFVNNTTGKIGLVGYWDVVAFDEFAGKQKKTDKTLVDILKNYMANKSFSRGIETLGAEASMTFVGNTKHTVPYMLKNSDLFDELPASFYDSAFLDRIHFYIPGWEVDIIRGEMFSNGYGFVVDYLAEILRSMRNYDYSDRYTKYFSLSSDISTRDRDGINKTFSGLYKILFPHDDAIIEEIEQILKFAIEGRKRVKDQLMRIDATYTDVDFSYTDNSGNKRLVQTLEEKEYPIFYYQRMADTHEGDTDQTEHKVSLNIEKPQWESSVTPSVLKKVAIINKKKVLKEKHLTFGEGQKGVSYDGLFAEYLKGATKITITDPYIRKFYQIRNLMEILETIAKIKSPEQEIIVELITAEDEYNSEQQINHLDQICNEAHSIGILFSWKYGDSASLHARYIVADTGWKISLDRGLDMFQHYDMNETFSFSNRLQQFRPCKAFEVTYIKQEHKRERNGK